MDSDPPRYDERRAVSWLVLFMTHIAAAGAAVLTENATGGGGAVEIIDHTDPHFRSKLAKRLGLAEHPDRNQRSPSRIWP